MTFDRNLSILLICGVLLGAVNTAWADGWRDRLHDRWRINRTENRIDRLQNAQRFDIRHSRYFAAGMVHEKILMDRSRLRSERRDMRFDRRDRR